MQKKTNIRLLISLGLLIAMSFILLLLRESSSAYEVDKNLFRVADPVAVNRILIQSPGNQKLELAYEGNRWVINQEQDADRQLVTIFFATLLQAEPKREVAESKRDSVAQQISSKGIHVQLYTQEELVKDFWVLGNDTKTETYMQLQGDPIPYLVVIPGYRVYLASVFELAFEEWRDKRVFNFNWQNFKSLTLKYPNNPTGNFTISFQGNYFGIEGLPKADTTRLNDFLDAVSLLQVTRYLTNDESIRYDSLLQPEFSIQISDIANRFYQLEVYPKKSGERFRTGRVNQQSWAFFEPAEIDRIAQKSSAFQ